MPSATPSTPTYKVRFFSAAASRASRGGVRATYFSDRAEAETFASTQTLYGRPCKVETLAPLTPAQQVVANGAAFGVGQ